MTSSYNNVWIHVAGNPPAVKEKKPPFWRCRVEQDGSVFYIHKLTVGGKTTLFNNRQGVHIGASFLLWWALYGDLRVEETPEGMQASIWLLDHNPTSSLVFGAVDTRMSNVREVRIYGAPDRVAESHLRWRSEINGASCDIATWVLLGDLLENQFSLGQNIENENHMQRLWLSFHSLPLVEIDSVNNAVFHLQPKK